MPRNRLDDIPGIYYSSAALSRSLKDIVLPMLTVVAVQAALLAVFSAAAWIFSGKPAALSLFSGGFCYFAPTLLGVAVLKSFRRPQMYAFFIGEALKIVSALILMVSVFVFFHDRLVVWAFLAGLLIVSQAVYLIIWKDGFYGK